MTAAVEVTRTTPMFRQAFILTPGTERPTSDHHIASLLKTAATWIERTDNPDRAIYAILLEECDRATHSEWQLAVYYSEPLPELTEAIKAPADGL